MRRLAAIGLAAALAAPVVAAAQSPSPAPSLAPPHLQTVCLRIITPPVIDAVQLMRMIADDVATVVAVVPCEPPWVLDPDATPTPRPVATTSPPTVFPTPRPTTRPTEGPAKAEHRTLGKRAWQKLLRTPDDHLSERIRVWACISQFDAATGTDAFLGDASYKRLASDDYWLDGENALFSGDAEQLSDFVEDDIVSMDVTVLGSYSYDTQAGGNTTVPWFQVDSIRRRGSCD